MLFTLLKKVSHAMNHRQLGAILLILALAGCASQSRAHGDAAKAGGCNLSMDFENLAAEFRSLRTVKGHFEGGPWNADVDKWMGRKHEVMIQMASRLGTGGCRRREVIQWLGPPDLIAREGDPTFDLINRSPRFGKPAKGPYELLIYYWRGMHDFLYFTSQGETMVNSGWWYAGE